MVNIDIFTCTTGLQSLDAIAELGQSLGAAAVSIQEIARADGHYAAIRPAPLTSRCAGWPGASASSACCASPGSRGTSCSRSSRVQAAQAARLFGAPALPVEATLACSGADAIALCLGAVLAYPVAVAEPRSPGPRAASS